MHEAVQNDRSGFTLVITLIMVVLAAILVIALMTSASSERTIATSYASRFNAELAVQNGLEAAKKTLTASPNAGLASVTADDTFLVLRADGAQTNAATGAKDAYYFLAKARPGGANIVDCYPLFSGGTSSPLTIHLTTSPVIDAPTAPAAPFAIAPAQDSTGTKLYPQLLPFQQSAYTQWQEVRDPSDPAHLPYQRYTFWVEDAGGYLDAGAVGNVNGAGNTHQRGDGKIPQDIALFTIFDPAIASDSGATLAKNLLNNRALLFTSPLLQQVAPPPLGQSDATQPNLAVRLGADAGGEQDLIPFGFGYQDEGKAKTNLNKLITDASLADDVKVTTVAKVVNDNLLPQFATTRKGALAASEDYVKTLAAGMIAYATGEPVVGANYRGLGHHPMVVEFFERFTWEKPAGETQNFYQRNGTWWADVRAKGYIQVWNMTRQPISSGSLTFADINRFYAYVGGTSDQNKFDDALSKGTIVFGGSNTLKANEFKVFQVYEHLYSFDTGLTIRPTGSAATVKLASFAGSTTDPTDCGYFCEWNGKVIDRSGAGTLDGARDDGTDRYPGLNYSGVQRSYASLTTPNSASDPKWRGTLPGLRYDDTSETRFNLGDPRSAYYIGKVQANVAYEKQSAWWGRIFQDGLVNTSHWKAAETNVVSWPDGGHSTGKGSLPPTTATDPMTLAPAILETNKAPTSINGTGAYTSITELARIYDPIQWKPAGFPPSSAADCQQKWQDAWKTIMTPDPDYGCGSTLRIGSPEFKNFDTMKTRASRLLDLFSVSDRIQTRGLVNVNTASRESLRALAAGIQLQRDLAIVPASVFGPLKDPASPSQGDMFADAVIANRPFLSPSQLSDMQTTLTDSNTKLFGNSVQWIRGGPTEWDDPAREEYFSRIFGLTTVRSRNFRIFVTGQSLDKNNKVLSTVSRVFQLHLRTNRDVAGAISTQNAEITYERDL